MDIVLGDPVGPCFVALGAHVHSPLSFPPLLSASCFWNIWNALCPAMSGLCG